MRNEEHNLQVVLCRYLDLKKIPYFAIPNGGARNIIVATKLKAEGVKKGVADLFIMVGNSKHYGLFIEVKVGKNKQQDSQIEFESLAKKQGYAYNLIYSLDELIEYLDIYLQIR